MIRFPNKISITTNKCSDFQTTYRFLIIQTIYKCSDIQTLIFVQESKTFNVPISVLLNVQISELLDILYFQTAGGLLYECYEIIKVLL